MRNHNLNSLPGKQKGATLAVALIILVLIALIGAGTLRSAKVSERLASNDYQKNITFQASESAVDQVLSFAALPPLTPDVPLAEVANVGIVNANANVVYTLTGQGPVDGASIGSGGVSGQRIMITSTGAINAGPNSPFSTTVHGIVRLVPGEG